MRKGLDPGPFSPKARGPSRRVLLALRKLCLMADVLDSAEWPRKQILGVRATKLHEVQATPSGGTTPMVSG